MRPHLTFHNNARVTEAYIFRDGAKFVGGTIPCLPRHRLTQHLDRLAGPNKIIHMTLSLPAGQAASNAQWTRIILTALREVGLPQYRTPWVAARHVDANCDHVHVVIASRTFCGQPLEPRVTRQHTDRVHKTLARLIGLTPPAYFDPEVPTLTPTVPARNLKRELNRRLHADLNAVFRNQQPRDLYELDSAMLAAPGGFRREDRMNGHGTRSHLWSNADGSVWGGELGLGWEPRYLERRFSFARQLEAARRRLAESAILNALYRHQSELEELIHAREHTENTSPAAQGSGPSGTVVAEREKHPAPSSSPRTAPGAGERSVEPRSGTTDHPDAGFGRAAPEPRAARIEPAASGAPGAETRPRSRYSESSGRVTFGHLLAHVIGFLSGHFRDWRLTRQGDTGRVLLRFMDESIAAVGAEGGVVRQAGAEAQRFCSIYQPLLRPKEGLSSEQSAAEARLLEVPENLPAEWFDGEEPDAPSFG